ncbi:DUF2309 family protein, partial [Escherichia coli]|nr:DUF2309 family protein [Escherichia coli]
IRTFAARTPWGGMEQEPFEDVARRLKTIVDVDILPNESVLRSAQVKGEIRQDFLNIQLKKWLDSQSFDLPDEVVEDFCLAALST